MTKEEKLHLLKVKARELDQIASELKDDPSDDALRHAYEVVYALASRITAVGYLSDTSKHDWHETVLNYIFNLHD